ncbi:dephospho-CoA kinase [Spiractinospora alimapuensis]|uniref:dephospho-CoA kinase n=1 Tax=Spiractinospora alimapuensis TaxID=2820884 RepID=UPI001F301EB0|nr:dephospho-CoA kinase [Spiractinospora alimapuensis]QVQ53069.1 dephospho-CoA kinase [Spiractinospora alimapuensis]
MRRVGLTGGIGSGKSEVARRLAARGAVVVDADQVAREVVAPGTPGLRAVVERFGTEVLRPDGALDRERLGRLVFADADELAALNAIVHPRVAARTQELVAAAPDDAVVVYDVPLLVENDLGPDFDVVVVVDAPEDVRLARLVRDRGMDEAHAKERIAAQASRERRLAAADHVIDNSGALTDLDSRVEALWREIVPGG